MEFKNTARQEAQVRTLKVMTCAMRHDWRILSFKDTPSGLDETGSF